MEPMDHEHHMDTMMTLEPVYSNGSATPPPEPMSEHEHHSSEGAIFEMPRLLKALDFYFGHNIPALVVFLWCAWGSFVMFCKMHRQSLYGTPYLNATCTNWRITRGVPVEAIVRTVVAAYTALHYLMRGVSMVGSTSDKGEPVVHYYLRQIHHTAILSSFSVAFLCEAGAKLQTRRSTLRHYLPPRIEYYTLALAFFLQSVVFYFHLDDRSSFQQNMHLVQLVLILLTMFAVIAETSFPQKHWCAMLRWHLIITQALWLIVLETAAKPTSLGLAPNVWHHHENPERAMAYVAPVFVVTNFCSMMIMFGISKVGSWAVQCKWFNIKAMPKGSVDGEEVVQTNGMKSVTDALLNDQDEDEDLKQFSI